MQAVFERTLATNRSRIFHFNSMLFKIKSITLQRNITLSVTLYECESWSLIIKKKQRWAKLFVSRALSNTLGPRREEIAGS
jgi:hypothetical protein